MRPASAELLLICLALPIAAVGAARASDHRNLEEDIPVRVEDAYPLEYRELEGQGVLRYENRSGDLNEGLLEAKLEWGIIRNGQIAVHVPGLVDNDGFTLGDVALDALYNLNVETVYLPALSFSADVDFPTGRDREGVDVSIKAILTKGVAATRFHANASYTFFGSPAPGERDQAWFAGLGLDHPITLDMLFVGDVWTERGRSSGEENIYVGEVGIRWAVSPYRVFSAGLGGGIGEAAERPNFRAVLGMQQSF